MVIKSQNGKVNTKTEQNGIRTIIWKPAVHTKHSSCKDALLTTTFWHVTSQKKLSTLKCDEVVSINGEV